MQTLNDKHLSPSAKSEQRRLVGDYSRYRASARKRRVWSKANPGNAAIRDELVKAVFLVAGRELMDAGAILDVGCGSGWWLERMAGDDRVSARLEGVELLHERAVAAQGLVPTAAVTVADARELPFDAGSFDVVTLLTVLSSLSNAEDAERVLCEVRRVLRPGGALLIWEPRIRNPLNRATVFMGRPLLERCLAGTRVQIRTITVLPALARRLGRSAGLLYAPLARIAPLRSHRLVCARTARDCTIDPQR